MEIPRFIPLKSAVYLVVLREQNTQVLNECLHSMATLRRFHPQLPVFIYYDNLEPEHLEYLHAQPNVLTFPIGIDRTGKFVPNMYTQKYGWKFPELYVLAAKIDALLLTPGDTLFLDSDTEVKAPLSECLESRDVWMHEDEGRFVDHDRDFSTMFEQCNFGMLGWQGDREKLHMLNSGAVYVPEEYKLQLLRAKEFLWQLAQVDPEPRGDNRLDEQIAMSIAFQEATGHRVRCLDQVVDHYWLEKYEGDPARYVATF